MKTSKFGQPVQKAAPVQTKPSRVQPYLNIIRNDIKELIAVVTGRKHG